MTREQAHDAGPSWSDWLSDLLPASVAQLLTPNLLLGLTLFGIVCFVGGVVGVPFFVSRLPADYFSGRERRALGIESPQRSALALLFRVLKNVLGLLLVACGVLMLILPGQGLLTILVGTFFVDFPGKRRFERWILTRAPILRGINRFRQRAGQPPLEPRASWVPPDATRSPGPKGPRARNQTPP